MTNSFWASFKCHRCGQCCKKLGLPWSPNNIERIGSYLKIKPEDLINRYYGEITIKNSERFVTLDRVRTNPCPFLKSGRNCSIYPDRPDSCKAYPVETDFGRCGITCLGIKHLPKDAKFRKQDENMGNSFDLLFLKRSKEMLAGPPLAKICIRPYPSDIIKKYEADHIFITKRCDSLREIEEEIDRLEKELEIIRKKAKRKFAGEKIKSNSGLNRQVEHY